MTNKTHQYRDLLTEINKQENEIMNSNLYISNIELLEQKRREMQKIEEHGNSMILPIIQLRESAAILHLELLAEGVDESIATIKFKQKKEVNISRVHEVLDDQDAFMGLAKISQADLKGYWVDHLAIKKDLEACVEVISETPTDVILNDE